MEFNPQTKKFNMHSQRWHTKNPLVQMASPRKRSKILDNYGIILLRETIRKYWNNNEYNPEMFTHLGLCVLPKSGDLSNPHTWRGIALGNIITEIISSIIATRLTQHINTFGIDEQCGCLFGKGSPDATFTLKTSLQTIREHQLDSRLVCGPCESIRFRQSRTLMEDTETVWNTRQSHNHPKKTPY